MKSLLWAGAAVAVGATGVFGVLALAERIVEARRHKQLSRRETFANVDGKRVRYRLVAGPQGAPWVVLLSGFPAALEEYSRMQQALSPYVSTLSFDRCGSGFSSTRFHPCDGVMQAKELDGLLSALGVSEPVILVGYSGGAMQGRVYTGAWPEKVRALVLLDPSPPEYTLQKVGFVQRRKFDLLIVGLCVKRAFGFTRIYRTIKAPKPMAQQGDDAHGFEFNVSVPHWWAALMQSVVLKRTELQALHAKIPPHLPVRLITTGVSHEPGIGDLLSYQRRLVDASSDGQVEVVSDTSHFDFMYNAKTIGVVVRTVRALIGQDDSAQLSQGTRA